MAKFLIFTIILLLIFAYVVPDNLVQKIPYGSDIKNFVVSIVNKTKGLIDSIKDEDFIKQLFQQSKISAVEAVNDVKNYLKDNLKQRVSQQIDKGVDRVIPTPSR
ncbi:MAG: hypothetical protein HYV65_00190 [Candidatus Spechtbacteria bacterium]|nr:hypothetical protein [Candidatus Spechtbacteria bacterium]